MKFVVENLSKCAPRLGLLTEIENHANRTLQTPLAMLYTKGGCLPHITREVFKLLSQPPQIIQVPLVSTYQYREVMEEYYGSIAEFVGLKDCLTCVAVQDPGDLTQMGHHKKDMVPLWTRQGKVLINADQYMNTIEAFKPDMYYFLSDGDTNAKSSNKRVTKAVENTIQFFNHCLQRHKDSSILKKSFPLAAIAGGYCEKARKTCIDAVINDIVEGYLIDGLHNNGPEVEFVPFEEPKPIVEYVIAELPPNKLRIIHGCWNPMVVLKMVKLGVDVFDTSYCNLITERSSALVFSIDINNTDDNPYEINLRKPMYQDDFKPILDDCECLTCKKHTKAYIHHLVTVQELLGPLLLTIHNNHHFLKFFEAIRKSIKDGTLDKLEHVIEKQFKLHQKFILKPLEEKPKSSANIEH